MRTVLDACCNALPTRILALALNAFNVSHFENICSEILLLEVGVDSIHLSVIDFVKTSQKFFEVSSKFPMNHSSISNHIVQPYNSRIFFKSLFEYFP